MMATIWHQHARRAPDDPSPMAALARRYHARCWGGDFPAHGRAAFERHNAAVRDAAQGRRFLEYEVGSGWASLCGFLGVPVPGEPFPHSDDWLGYKKMVADREAVAASS